MHAPLDDLLHRWHDFYLLLGTAAATLVGLMFVAASIGARVFGPRETTGLHAFVTPTVVHFSTVLFVGLLAMVPSHTRATYGGVLALAGAAGVAQMAVVSYVVLVRRKFKIDNVDRLFYALLPLAGYGVLLASGLMLLGQVPGAFEVTAAALAVLLVAAIRNSWDMMVWIVLRTPSDDAGSPSDRGG